MYTTSELQQLIEGLYAKLEPVVSKEGVFRPLKIFWRSNTPRNTEGGFCYSDDSGYHFGYSERGNVSTFITTDSLVEIVYSVLSSYITGMSGSYECKHRINDQYNRRLFYKKRLEYWGIIGKEYQDFAEHKTGDGTMP